MITCVATRIFIIAAVAKVRTKTSIVRTARAIPRDWLVGIRRHGLLRLLFLSRHPGIFAIPKGPGIAKAVSNGDRPVAESLDSLEHVLREVVDCLLMGIMGDNEPGLGEWVTLEYLVIKNILGSLDQVRTIILVVICVNIIENNVVAKFTQMLSTFCVGGATGIGWPHVARELTKDVAYRSFILLHLFSALGGSDLAQILMRPSVAGNLVATRMHTLDQRSPRQGEIIDSTLAVVDAGDEECCLCIIFVEQVKQIPGVTCWAIVEG